MSEVRNITHERPIKVQNDFYLKYDREKCAERKHVMERESGIIRNIDIRYEDDNKHILTAINIARCLRFVVISNDMGRSSIIVVPGAQQVKTSHEDRKVLQTSFSSRKLASSEHSKHLASLISYRTIAFFTIATATIIETGIKLITSVR